MARTYGSAAARGYGIQHQKIRAGWKPRVGSGQVRCHADICLEERDGRSRWITPGTPWHLGHTPDRSGWTGPEHARCGAADGARRGNQNRPRTLIALKGRDPVCASCGQAYHYAAKQCMICGRHYHPTRGEQYTCSRACGVQYKRRRGVQLPIASSCEVCGTPCGRQNRTCGKQQCVDELRIGQRRTLTCQRCGKEFTGRSAKYCSANCQSLAYYYDHRGEVLAKLATQRRAEGVPAREPGTPRTSGRCQGCGKIVWRSERNRVGDGWACVSCRRRDVVTVNQSRDW